MHIVSVEKLNKFAQRHPNARSALNRWYKLIEEGTFSSIVELRETFPHADSVKVRKKGFSAAREEKFVTVFNIGGNKARLIASIEYDMNIQTVRIDKVLTHEEYDRGRWKE